MIEVDLLLRIAVAFLKDMDLEEFKKLVFETAYLTSDINNFSSDKIPKDSKALQSLYDSKFEIYAPRLEAEILLAFVLNTTRVDLHTNSKREVNDFNKQRYFKLLALRKSGVPLEYLTNTASFYGIDFYVDKNVLIPRSESEILVDKALELMSEHNITDFVEVGVGSGAISLSILHNNSNARCIATDISSEAINIARYNAERLNLLSRIEFIESNLLDSKSLLDSIKTRSITLVISNPPYIANDYPLSKEVLCEPHIALFGGVNGDEILCRLAKECKENHIKYLICEMGYNQKDSMQSFLLEHNYNPRFYKDYAKSDRGFVASLIVT